MNTSDLLANGKSFFFWEKEQKYFRDLHVNCTHPDANDSGDGSRSSPFKTIQAAADTARPGERVVIHAGEYREHVRPARGGNSPDEMICYEAAGDGDVIIKASETVTDFEPSTGWRKTSYFMKGHDVNAPIWLHRLDPEMFKGYNPFCAVNIIHDRLFIEFEKTDMTTYLNRRGIIFCDGKPLKQVPLYNHMTLEDGTYWVEANGQTIHFRLPGDDSPDGHLIEISCREQCFAPVTPFLSYIKVKGLKFAHAATGGPVPQRGALSCYRGHHWIIEDCDILWSNTVAIDVGNECWHHERIKGQTIGHSIIRRCKILDSGVCGIAGLNASHMLIEDNLIEGTGWQKMELSWEAAGIKLHHSVDGLFRRNIFKRTYRADHLWLDVGNENNRITQNLFLDGIEQREAIFMECSKDDINLIDNNIIWNVPGRFSDADIPVEPGSSGWYKQTEHDVVNGYGIYGEGTDHLRIVNNLIGNCRSAGYFSKPVSFRLEPMQRGGTSRDAHILGNIFYNCGEAAIKLPTEKNTVDGNLYVKMPGGYLRIFYPAPAVNLDLPAWTKFYGFDREGCEAWFDINADTENYCLTVKAETGDVPALMWVNREFLLQPNNIRSVSCIYPVNMFFNGDSAGDGTRIPGPFEKLSDGTVISIDPRKI